MKLSSDEFKALYSKVPRLTVEIVVQNELGTLLTLRDVPPYEGWWHIPGGTVRFREPVRKAVKRIAKAELGVDVNIKEFLGYIEYLDNTRFGGFDYPVGLAFLVKPISSHLKHDFQSTEIKYFKKLPKKLIKEQRQFIVRNTILNTP